MKEQAYPACEKEFSKPPLLLYVTARTCLCAQRRAGRHRLQAPMQKLRSPQGRAPYRSASASANLCVQRGFSTKPHHSSGLPGTIQETLMAIAGAMRAKATQLERVSRARCLGSLKTCSLCFLITYRRDRAAEYPCLCAHVRHDTGGQLTQAPSHPARLAKTQLSASKLSTVEPQQLSTNGKTRAVWGAKKLSNNNNNNKLITPFGQLRPLQGGNLPRVANLKEVDHKLSSRQVCIEPLHECPHGS